MICRNSARTLVRIAAAAIALASGPSSARERLGYTLAWSDEFDGAGVPDPAKWSYDTHANKAGWYNHELQYYAADRPENARIEGGRLIITARKESLADRPDQGGQRYTSARLITKGKAEWTYGVFEIRAKLPCGKGSWPAIWMLGAAAGWPDGGEIDIMEHVGKAPGEVSGTIHNRSTAGTFGKSGQMRIPDACDAFHDYQIDWTPEAITFAVDGKTYHRYVNAKTGTAQWPFDKPQYLLLNLAIGGEMGGDVDDGIFPIRFEIDHVRVYQRTAGTGGAATSRR
ncbi:family 16 glycosylhydrolase [Sphingosinicella sp. BN140058]|uniref:glycoside hydrolase family 16 protein n=1 Tax=Sphingosinicella sp. BN140058 TaxID=1892855 RepID=UPI0010114629|nr:glycoside hydrolase family 16 protein [Sphingosinicella sp. BN140058]QAY79076.1 glycoside hydrolase family 16 protein [Sphingosinicella sp. BN140058]